MKWRNFKMLMANNKYFWDAKQDYVVPRLIDLLVDPKEREPVNAKYLRTWVMYHTSRMLQEFQQSLAEE